MFLLGLAVRLYFLRDSRLVVKVQACVCMMDTTRAALWLT